MPRGQGGTLSGFTPLSTPNAPNGLSVSTSIGSATVSFEPPADTGDAPITSFIVTAIDESTGESTGATGSASPITVSPPAGGTFKIRAQAVNGFGPGRLTEFSTGNTLYAGAELYAWGYNAAGSLGDNTTVSKSSPVQVGALTTWRDVKSGANFTHHVAALKTDGTLWAWGRNDFGQVGDNTTVARSSPVQVGALTTWSKLAAGQENSLALKESGSLWAWGRNNSGQLGDGTVVYRSSPVQIGALTTWSYVGQGSLSLFSFAIKTDGTLWAWGSNNLGQLGDSTTVNKSSPVQVGLLTNWSKASPGLNHAIAVKTDGTFWAWGNGQNGALGDGTATSKSSPVQIGALTNWSQPSAGNTFSGAVKINGQLWTWGNGNDGRTGHNDEIDKSSPVQVGTLTNWLNVSLGSVIGSAIKTDGTLWTWGSGGNGQLGDNATSNQSSPVQIGALTDWVSVSAGNKTMSALIGVV
jgi:alpha-tubulin suppressor-like RCC1 family protein